MRTPRDAVLSVQRFFAGFLEEPWEVLRAVDGDPPDRPYALIEQLPEETPPASPALQTVAVPVVVNCYLAPGSTRKAADDAALELRELVWQRVKWGAPPYRRLTTDRIPLYAYEPREEVQRIKIGPTAIDFTLTLEGEQTAALDADVDALELVAGLEALPSVEPGDIAAIRRGDRLFDVVFTGSLAGVDVDPMVGERATVKVLLEGAPAPWRAAPDYMRVASFGQTTIRDDDDPRIAMVAVDLRLTFALGAPVPLGQTILQRVENDERNPG